MLKKIIFLSFIGFLAIGNQSQAQSSSVDTIIEELYQSISFDSEKEPDYEKFKSLFIEEGRLISVKDTTSYSLSPTDYQQSMTQQRKSGNIISFTEKELDRKVEEYGNILHIFSTYQTYLETPDGNNSARGINSIQLMKKEGQWKVVSLIWYEEDKAHPLPKKYLPSGN